MGNDIQKGTTYSDGNTVNASNLNAHVDDATFKSTCISARTAKDPAALSDEFLINDAGTLKKVTGTVLYELFVQAGSIIQTQYAEYTANTNLTTSLPADDTIPQNTEGNEIISLSITPRYSDSVILCRFQGFGAGNAAANLITALFRDSIADALTATAAHSDGANVNRLMALEYRDSPATTSPVTYKIRVGGPSVTIRMNGTSAARFFGGVARSTLVLQEIKV